MSPYELPMYKEVSVEDLPGWLRDEVVLYAEARPELAEPEIARGKCGAASGAFIDELLVKNFLSRREFVERWAVDEVAVLRDPVEGWEVVHYAARVDDWIIDFTARQFDPAVTYPLVWRLA